MSENSAAQEYVVATLALTPDQRRFVEEYCFGDFAGNGTKSYMAVYPEASYETASVEASRLLKEPKVVGYLTELHERAVAHLAGKVIAWADLLPMAQGVIIATAQGRLRNRLAYEAAVYVTNRVEGTPVASHDIRIRDDSRITRALAAFTKRVGTTALRPQIEEPTETPTRREQELAVTPRESCVPSPAATINTTPQSVRSED